MTEDQQELLEKVQEAYPTGWFMASYVKSTRAKLQELVDLGYLDVSGGFRSTVTTFKLRDEELWPEED
jgi:hypothetical protein